MQRPIYVPFDSNNFDNPIIIYDLEQEPLSRFHDNIWDFSPSIHNRNVNKARALIDFNCPLEDGSKLTDINNHRFLKGVKHSHPKR